jgi:biopolymer transport protein ExbB/TolQ
VLFSASAVFLLYAFLNGNPFLDQPTGNGWLNNGLVSHLENSLADKTSQEAIIVNELAKSLWTVLEEHSKIASQTDEEIVDEKRVQASLIPAIQDSIPDILVRTGNYLCPENQGFCSWPLWLQPLAQSYPSNREVANALLSCQAWESYVDHLESTDRARITLEEGNPCGEHKEDSLTFATIIPAPVRADFESEEAFDEEKQKRSLKRREVQEYFNTSIDQAMKMLRSDLTYNGRRVFFGLIQTLTIFLFFSGLAFLIWTVSQMLLCAGPLTKMEILYLQTKDQFCFYRDFIAELYHKNPKNMQIRLSYLTNEAYQASQGSVNETRTVLGEDTNQLREELMSQGAWVRFVVFAIPAIGFVGTVLGISQALGDADKVLSEPTDTLKIAAIQAMTTKLAVAFDTTLVSLLLGIVLNLLVESAGRLQERNLFAIYDEITQRNINRLQGADPDCKNKNPPESLSSETQ